MAARILSPMLLDKDTLVSRRAEIAPALGEIIVDHLLKFGRADICFVDGKLYASESCDVVDLMSVSEEVALRILALTGASDADMENYLTRRETRSRKIPPTLVDGDHESAPQ